MITNKKIQANEFEDLYFYRVRKVRDKHSKQMVKGKVLNKLNNCS